jgi:predicted neutral ceramidase superfamily lipid hydrolase
MSFFFLFTNTGLAFIFAFTAIIIAAVDKAKANRLFGGMARCIAYFSCSTAFLSLASSLHLGTFIRLLAYFLMIASVYAAVCAVLKK